MKKLLALLLVLAMVLALFVGCASKETAKEDAPKEDAAKEDAAKEDAAKEDAAGDDYSKLLEGYKFCLIMPHVATVLHNEVVDYWEYLSDELGAEFTYYDANNDSDKFVDLLETAINWGADVIGLQASSGNEVKMAQIAEDAGAYIVSYFTDLPENIKEEVRTYSSWAGAVYENEFEAGYYMAKSLADKGAKKYAVVTLPVGYPVHDARYAGIEAGVEEAGGEIITTARVGVAEFSNAASNACALGDQIDALIMIGAGLDYGAQVVVNSGRAGELLFSTVDLADNTIAMMEQNVISSVLGGHYIDSGLAFALGARAAMGKNILDEEGKGPSIKANYMEFDTVEDVEIYNNYIFNNDDNEYWYYADEIGALIADDSLDFDGFTAECEAHAEPTQVLELHGISE